MHTGNREKAQDTARERQGGEGGIQVGGGLVLGEIDLFSVETPTGCSFV